MIVVVVGKDHGIDRRQAIKIDGGWHPSARTGKLYGRRPVTPHRVGKDVQTVHLNEEARVSNPGKRELPGRSSRHNIFRSRSHKRRWIWIGALGTPAPLDDRPLQKIKKAVHLRGWPGILESAASPVVRKKP
jgi:hypothetical protein